MPWSARGDVLSRRAPWGSLCAEPDVFEAAIHPVAGHGLVVVDARRPHFEPRPPQAREPPGLRDDLLLQRSDELGALVLVPLDFLLGKQLINHGIAKAPPVVGRIGDEL